MLSAITLDKFVLRHHGLGSPNGVGHSKIECDGMLAGLSGGTHGRVGGAEPCVSAAPLHRLEEETIMESIGIKMPELPGFVAIIQQARAVAATFNVASSSPHRADRSS